MIAKTQPTNDRLIYDTPPFRFTDLRRLFVHIDNFLSISLGLFVDGVARPIVAPPT